MLIVYRGNHQPDLVAAGGQPYSTESHIAGSLELLGHHVIRVQEDRVGWSETVAACDGADLMLWTSTQGMAHLWDRSEARAAVDVLNGMLPTAAVHLDLFFGLSRAHWVDEEPWFRVGTVFTADGDHDADFVARGIRHRWLPPAVYGPECVPGTPQPGYGADVAFVGSWRGYGHPEHWPVRAAMLDYLHDAYGARFRCWPQEGQPAVRGQALNDLYASTKVVVGDSCLAAQSRRYVSDRPFETVGRGGFLIFPYIEALAEMLVDGQHIRYFEPGNHAQMHNLIEYYLGHDDEREIIRRTGQAHVAAHHTYTQRVAEVLWTLDADGAFKVRA